MATPRKPSQDKVTPVVKATGVLRPHQDDGRGHNRFSPSASDRWLTCHGSTVLIESLGNDKPKVSAKANDTDLGSAAHALLDLCLETGTHPEQYRNRKIWSELYTVDDDMIDAIDSALDYINGLRTMLATDNALLRDIRVEVPGVTDGTLDVAIYDGTNLHVLDYKNGAGVPVTARENSQMGLYALGCESLLKRKFKKVVLHIIQPRCNRRANPADDWTASRKWLDDLSSRAYSAVKNADDPHAEFKPSDKGCRWCKAKAVCPALARVALGEAKQDFGIIDGTAAPCKIDKQSVAKPLTPDQLTAAFQNLPLVFAWAEAVEKEVLSRLENGKPVPGLKLVEGRANRQWSDEKNAINALMREGLDMDDIAPRTIVGIGKAEKLLPKDKREQVMNRLTVRPAGKPTIAPADDPRPPITGDAANDFADHIEDPLLR